MAYQGNSDAIYPNVLGSLKENRRFSLVRMCIPNTLRFLDELLHIRNCTFHLITEDDLGSKEHNIVIGELPPGKFSA